MSASALFGGSLQHLDDTAYAQFVTDRIAGALAAHSLETEIRAPILSPPRTRRRAILHAEAKGGRVTIGFTEQSSHALVDVQECHILIVHIVCELAENLLTEGAKA